MLIVAVDVHVDVDVYVEVLSYRVGYFRYRYIDARAAGLEV